MFDWKANTPLTLDDIPEEEQRSLLDKVAVQIAKRRLAVPAIIILEVCKPLNFLGGQVLIALTPFLQSIFNTAEIKKFALIIEKDANVELLTQFIEDYSSREPS